MTALDSTLRTLLVPDTTICIEATDHVRSQSESFLFNHVIRSYAFAAAIANERNASVDLELLYLACVFHDMGLTKHAPAHTRFEVEGADAAVEFLSDRNCSAKDREIVWDAIALHTTHVIPQRKGPEVALCQLGTAVDVGYAPTLLVPTAALGQILSLYPRLAFKERLPKTLCGLLKRGKPEAGMSHAVSEAAERLLPKYERGRNICDVIQEADFPE